MKLPENEYNRVMTSALRLISKKGLKAMTMDDMAADLGMSKRTLYEHFTSKAELLMCALRYMYTRHIETIEKTFREADNVLEALLTIYERHRKVMNDVSPSFFRDMDKMYPEVKEYFKKMESSRSTGMMKLFEAGVREGVFRGDVNYRVQMHLLHLQMEALKRMEEVFPPDTTLSEVYDSINISFLRSIASPKGMEMLNKMTVQMDPERTHGVTPAGENQDKADNRAQE